MLKTRVLLVAGVILMASACSTESAKRTGYETLQNMREQECQKDLTSECEKRESYEAYQRNKKEVEESK
jgi:hypothetical protein